MNEVDKIVMERVGEYKKYSIGETLIAIVPSDESLYDPLIGKTAKKVYDYVKANQDDFDIASPVIRIGLLALLGHYCKQPKERW